MTLHLTIKKKKSKERNRNLMTEVQFKIIKIIFYLPLLLSSPEEQSMSLKPISAGSGNYLHSFFRALTPSTISLLLLCNLFLSLEPFPQPLNPSNFLDPTSSLYYSPLFSHTTRLFEKAIKYVLEMFVHSILYWLCPMAIFISSFTKSNGYIHQFSDLTWL